MKEIKAKVIGEKFTLPRKIRRSRDFRTLGRVRDASSDRG